MPDPSVALVHDWLDGPGGGEAVLTALVAMFPRAPVFTLVDFLSEDERACIGVTDVRTSWVQRVPGSRRWFRQLAAVAPEIIGSLDPRNYDVLISDSHAIAKGIPRRPGQLHICYCHSPARFAWTMAAIYENRLTSVGYVPGAIVRMLQRRFRRWDKLTAEGVDHFIANSSHIALRVRSCYGREAIVVNPPVDLRQFSGIVRRGPGEGYMTVSRLVPYKRVDLIIEAFRRMPDRRLVVVGDGPERVRLERHLPSNVSLVGRIEHQELARLLGDTRAFVFAAEEDFGIAAIEAQAAGVPVIAFGGGGLSETIRDLDSPQPTGVLFDLQTPASMIDAIFRFEAASIESGHCRDNAARFSYPRFEAEIRALFDQWIYGRYDLTSTQRPQAAD